MRITNGGNVLIGTTTDSGYKLDVNGTGRFSSNVAIGSTLNSWASGYRAVNIGSGFGIMASNTNYDGYILSNAYYDGSWKISNSATIKPMMLRLSDGFSFQIGTTAAINSATTFSEVLGISNTGAATFSSSVSVNGATANNTLNVYDTNNAGISLQSSYTGTTGSDGFYIGQLFQSTNFLFRQRENADIIFETNNGSERMRITSGGQVNIANTTNTTFALSVYGASQDSHIQAAGTAPSLRLTNAVTSATKSAVFGLATATNNFTTGSTAGDTAITWDSSNSLIFGFSNTSTEKARFNSSGYLLLNYTTSQGTYLLQANGNIYAAGYYESSDIRLKNIVATNQSDNFGAISFNWKAGRDGKTHWGYSAQEVQKFLPDAITEGVNGYLAVDYNQAHTYKIQKLEDRVTELESKLKKYEA